MKTVTIVTALVIVLASLAFHTSYMKGLTECPPGDVCYKVDASEKVRWRPGGYDTVLFKVTWYVNHEHVNNTWTGEGEVDAWNECWNLTDRGRYCEIHVVRPEFVWGDPKMDDLGHEVLHGFLDTDEGEFHE